MSFEKKSNAKDKYNQSTYVPVFDVRPEIDMPIEDTVNLDKYITLTSEIETAYKNGEITAIERKYLILAATRWIRWNYSNVAQYYAGRKTSDAMKRLLERSAMVLIDVNKAFEIGVVKSEDFIVNVTTNYVDTNKERMEDYDVHGEIAKEKEEEEQRKRQKEIDDLKSMYENKEGA